MSLAFDITHEPASSPAIPAKPVSFRDKDAAFPPKVASLDAQIVKAFRDMESVVNDAFYSGEMFRNTLDRHFGTSHPVNGKHDFELSPVEWETMFFALHQMLDLVGGVRRRYYAAYEDVPVSGSA